MKNNTTYNLSLTMASAGLTAQAYGIKDSKFNSPIDFDANDRWLGNDFDYLWEQVLDDFWDDIEDDLLSVWSTNRSEQ